MNQKNALGALTLTRATILYLFHLYSINWLFHSESSIRLTQKHTHAYIYIYQHHHHSYDYWCYFDFDAVILSINQWNCAPFLYACRQTGGRASHTHTHPHTQWKNVTYTTIHYTLYLYFIPSMIWWALNFHARAIKNQHSIPMKMFLIRSFLQFAPMNFTCFNIYMAPVYMIMMSASRPLIRTRTHMLESRNRARALLHVHKFNTYIR